jgi:hypothetical protein
MSAIQFVANFDDKSTDKGFQFKFYCDKCRSGFISEYQTNVLGVAGSVLSAAGSLFGGVLGRASSSAYELNRAVGGKAHDDALRHAVEEMRPKFRHCTRCGHWVCPESCWNEDRQLCEECAPDPQEEAAAAQAQAAKEQIWDKAKHMDQAQGVDLQQHATSLCPKCGAHAGTAKFCPECGTPLATKFKCVKCGAEADHAVKFCPECGAPRAA